MFYNKNLDLITKLTNINTDEIAEFSLKGIKTLGKMVECYDGDTCKIVLIVNNALNKFTCRLNNVDAPEMKPPLNKQNRLLEIAMACKCRNRLLQLATNCFDKCDINCQYKKTEINKFLHSNSKLIAVECLEFDKYGRLLVNLYDERNNDSYNDILISEKLVKQYDGGTKEAF
jgi:endonuclease YncB( thermonuclease family)